jgi:hypothetical protein
VDADRLHQLDQSLWRLATYNPPYRRYQRQTFNYPVTFGEEGGLVAGTTGLEAPLVCFTSTPEEAKAMGLVESCAPGSSGPGEKHEMGAGDAAATVVTLFNVVDPASLIAPCLLGREVQNRGFRELAATVFVSVMSRMAGLFVVKTKRCVWSNIRRDRFPALLEAVARESVAVARTLSSAPSGGARVGEIAEWGVRVLIWRLGSVCNPPGEPPSL